MSPSDSHHAAQGSLPTLSSEAPSQPWSWAEQGPEVLPQCELLRAQGARAVHWPQPSSSPRPSLSPPSIAAQPCQRPKQQRQSCSQRVLHLGPAGEGDPAKNCFNLLYFWQWSISQMASTVILVYVTLTRAGPDQEDLHARKEQGMFSMIMGFQ